ncbi:MAG TPA: twin-arginine translocase TatA/TatE family subunit [Pontiella sp.]|nr:twin-arginine translocase TatA/TatE family subunit [Pontiella sp.]
MDTLAIGMPGGSELLIILFVVLLLFGAKKLPELSRALGKSLGEFRKGQKEGDQPDEENEDTKEIPASDKPGKGE